MIRTEDLEAVSGDPGGLERLYRHAQATGQEAAFVEALQACATAQPDNLLLEAWTHRLDVPVERAPAEAPARRWWGVIGGSLLLGLVSVLLADGKPPVPAPGEAAWLFWVGWGPLVALGLLTYLAWAERARQHVKRYAVAAGAVLAVALYIGGTLGSRTDDAAVLGAIHLPFLAWAVVGAALCMGYRDPARQAYAYLVKSVETVLTGGIFFGAGVAFVGLTLGIFAVLGITVPEEDLVGVVAWGVGAVPLLAVGSVYDAARAPVAQDWQAGLTRTLRILTRLLLPLALGVLLVYVLWFIPVYFRKPFEEREVLLVYNLTILAIMVLLIIVVSGPVHEPLFRRSALFRYAVLGLGALTLVLNAYALAAVASRALEGGLTPNRFAVIGWNAATLAILGAVGFRLWQARRQAWVPIMRQAVGQFTPLAALWAAVLLLVLPWIP